MRNLTFAAGLATGYVLGARAGQERYEQIAKSARDFAGRPAVVQARSKAQGLAGAATDAVVSKIGSGMEVAESDPEPVDRVEGLAGPRP